MIRGSCHCGNVGFDLEWPVGQVEIPARACTCTFCAKHGAVWTGHPEARLSVRIDDASAAQRYTFGTHTAMFHVCRLCGVVAVCTSEIDGQLFAVVNVNAFDDFDRSRLAHRSVSFDGEAQADRLTRRSANWIARVAVFSAMPK